MRSENTCGRNIYSLSTGRQGKENKCIWEEIMKKTGFRKVLALLMASIMVLGLASCGKAGSSGSGSGQDSKLASDEKITLKFANYALLEDAYKEFWAGVKSGFEAKHPNITIEWVTAPYAEITSQVITKAGAGDKCDLVFGENSWISAFEDAGFAAAAADIMGEDYLKNFHESALDSCSVDGKAYGIPMYVSPFILYYNADIFKKAGIENPPETYDELLAVCAKIKGMKTDDGNDIYPFGQTTASVPISGTAINSMIYNFGGQVLTRDGKLSIDNEGFHQAIETLKTLDDRGYCPQNSKLKDLRNLFALGQLAIYYDQSWGISGVKAINPDAPSRTKSAVPLKGGKGSGASILSSNVLILGDNGDKRRAATKELVEYLLSDEVLGNYLTNIVPAYPAIKTMSQPKNPVLEGATGSVETAVAAPSVPALNDLNLDLTALAQAVTVSDENVDTAIANFKKSAENLLK